MRRLVVSPNSWASFLTHYVAQLGFSLEDVLRYPLAFDFSSFPPFYCSLLTAWRLVDGTWSSSHSSFVIASSLAGKWLTVFFTPQIASLDSDTLSTPFVYVNVRLTCFFPAPWLRVSSLGCNLFRSPVN